MPSVVDASAVVELLLRTPAGEAALGAIGNEPVFAPELLDAEVLSALAGLERGGKISADRADRAIEQLVGAPIDRVPHLGLVSAAWKRRASLSTYDGLYVALAARLDCPLVTADARLGRSGDIGVTITLVPTAG